VKARFGQVAVYLVLMLVAVCFLMLMCIGAYLAVSSKNKAMNAGDAAAIAVARHQGDLINRIGKLNIEHLTAAIAEDEDRCHEIETEQMELSLLGPVEGITIGNDAARVNGAERSDGMRDILAQHVIDVRNYYVNNPDLYPEAYEGAWEAYAQKIEVAIGGGIWAGPDNIEFLGSNGGHTLLTKCFYNAIDGLNWCWFYFHPGILDAYSSFRDWAPLPGSGDEVRRRRCVNSEIYSLHLKTMTGSAVSLLGTNVIMRLTGADMDAVESSKLLNDPLQKWFFYDEAEWRKWKEIDPFESGFPVMGSVKREYDVKGCAAACRVERHFARMTGGGDRETEWIGAAKPFGTLKDEDGEIGVVTSLANGFVVPSLTDVRLVPLDSISGNCLSTADPKWMEHVKNHLRAYLQSGPSDLSDCWYCQQLAKWERPSFRQAGKTWLKFHSGECSRCDSCCGGGRGGTMHGH